VEDPVKTDRAIAGAAPFTYTFQPQVRCNMCTAPVADSAETLGKRLGQHQGLRPRKRVGATTTIQRCGNCGLIFSNPTPIPQDIGQHYDVPAESYWAGELTVSDAYFARQIELFRGLWGQGGSSGVAALDIGAGVGLAMASLEKAGFDVFGLEPSASFREVAVGRNGISPDRLSLTGVEEADYPDESFDFVTFGAVVEHLLDPAACLERALRWTRPGGLIHVEVPSSDWLMARMLDFVYRVQGLDYTTHLSPMHSPFHLYEFTLASFERHAERAGYEIASHRRLVGSPYVPGLLRRPAVKLMERTGTGMQLEVWLRRPK
jgi:SAM-dependent methyltransferase